jgi:hypothetical protein
MHKPIVSFRQADPNWSTDVLGFSKPYVDDDGKHQPASTLGRKGCLVTAVAIASSGLAAVSVSPRGVNEAARKGGGFVAGTGSGRLPQMAASVGLVAHDALRVRDLDPSVPAEAARLRHVIDCALAETEGFFVGGGFCIINVDHTGDDRPDHFLVIVRRNGNGWDAIDPACGEVFIANDLTAEADWKGKRKHYVVLGAAPIGLQVRQ